MDAGSLRLLHRLIVMGSRSLLQYASESVPWSAQASKPALAHILTIAQEERDAATKLMRFLQKKRLRLLPLGSYPSHFTTGNFVSVDYLLPKLIAEHEKETAEIETLVSLAEDEEMRTVGQNYLDMKRRHLQSLKDNLPGQTPTAAA